MRNILNHLPSSINKIHKSIIVNGAKGSWVFCDKGKQYLDLTSGIGALSTGHCHSHISKMVKKQADKYVHIPQQVYGSHSIQIELTSKFLDMSPFKSLDNIFYTNSGSESTDNALKLARRFTGKKNIIAMNKGFHGRSLGALSITSSNLSCKLHTQPLIPGVFFCNTPSKSDLDLILNHQSSPEETSCIILEPVMGEGGIYSIDEDFLQYVRKVCTENNILFIADEVQCGSGRTGTWWNIEQKNVIPDIITFGKGVASGYPLAGILSRSEILSAGNNYLGGTYGGNAVCSAAALATIDIFNKENILQNVNYMSNYFDAKMKNIDKIGKIKNIRKYGLMIGIEMVNEEEIPYIISKMRENGVLLLRAGDRGQYIRLLPPLNISSIELDIFFEKFNNTLNDAK